MIPHLFVRIELWRVFGQASQSDLSASLLHVALDNPARVVAGVVRDDDLSENGVKSAFSLYGH
jgi:hypothetical protein